MTDWAAFAGFVGVVLALLLFLAHATQRAMTAGADADEHVEADQYVNAVDESVASDASLGATDVGTVDPPGGDPGAVGSEPPPDAEADRALAANGASVRRAGGDSARDEAVAGGSTASRHRGGSLEGPGLRHLSTTALLVNVAASQGVFLGLLAVAVWYAGVPLSALGLAPGAGVPGLSTTTATSPLAAATSLDLAPALALGTAFGVALYALNEVGAAAGERLGLGSSEELRESLAPDSPGGWAVLLAVVLPIIAGFEELLFRGALVGALTVGAVQAGLGVGAATPWLFAVVSSTAFALGHGAQGRGGVVVTGLLGLTLAGAFVLTWSLPLVFLAHYLINALEFVVHEFFGVDWI